MTYLKALVVSASILFSPIALSGENSVALSNCVAKSSTTEDKAAFVQWLFSAISIHPYLKSLANISDENREQSSKKFISSFSRLITVDCKEIAKLTLQSEGPDAVISSLFSLAQIASTETYSNPAVQQYILSSTARNVNPKMFDAIK